MRFVLGGTPDGQRHVPARIGARRCGGAARATRPGRDRSGDATDLAGLPRHHRPASATADWRQCPPGTPDIGSWAQEGSECDLYNSVVMAKIYRSGILSLGQGLWKVTSGTGCSGTGMTYPGIPPRVVPRMARPILTRQASLQDQTLGEVVSHPHAVRREHTPGLLQPMPPHDGTPETTAPEVAAVTDPTCPVAGSAAGAAGTDPVLASVGRR